MNSKKDLTAEIFSVGTEILLGDIVNTNSQFISEELASLGINVYKHTTIGDNKERLLKALELSYKNCDLIISTGGLGPTLDDITKETVAEFFGLKLLLDEKTRIKIENFLNLKDLNNNNFKQGYFPENSIIIENDSGTAPACIIEKNEKIFIMLPGPPRECRNIFKDKILPYLNNKTNTTFYTKNLNIFGIGESFIDEKLKDLIRDKYNPTVGTYVKEGFVSVRVTGKSESKEISKEMVTPVVKEIYKRLDEFIFSEDFTTLGEKVVHLLDEKGFSLSIAESCTGGMLASKIVDVSGASKVFSEGFVTYSNESKMKNLGVSFEVLEKYGAVSYETAYEMVKGLYQMSNSNICIAVTGIAESDSKFSEKLSGLTYFGISVNGEITVTEKKFKNTRNMNRLNASMMALDLIRRKCEKI